jgi:hypothetical protein
VAFARGMPVGVAILICMSTLPRDGSLLVRTDFTSDAAWQQLAGEAQRENEDGFQASVYVVTDPEFDHASWELVKAACPDDPGAAVLFIADSKALTSPGHPILVVDLLEDRAPFRCIPAELWSVENNLNDANMDWEEFADAADDDGIFRGFGE